MSKREFDEASSQSVSLPLNKKTKLDGDDDDSQNVVALPVPSSSSSSASGGYSVSSVGDDDDDDGQSSSFTSETTNEIAKDVVDLEAPQISEASIFREERKPVNEDLGETTEVDSSSDDRRKPPAIKTPTPADIDGFFSEMEEGNEDKKKRFIEKYNFDIVNDKPLQGRFQWDRINKN